MVTVSTRNVIARTSSRNGEDDVLARHCVGSLGALVGGHRGAALGRVEHAGEQTQSAGGAERVHPWGREGERDASLDPIVLLLRLVPRGCPSRSGSRIAGDHVGERTLIGPWAASDRLDDHDAEITLGAE